MRQEDPDALSARDTARVRPEDTVTPLQFGGPPDKEWTGEAQLTEATRRLELREEQLVAEKDLVDLGEIVVRTTVDEVPGRIEVDAIREEAEVEHVPVGQVVSERVEPWEEDGALVIPLYEEQIVVVKRLYLREHIRIRRVGTTARQVFEDTLRKERLVVEDPNRTGLVHEVFPRAGDEDPDHDQHDRDGRDRHREGQERPSFLENVVRKAFE
jgi:uncharacterized protein (TIGR02271 family)